MKANKKRHKEKHLNSFLFFLHHSFCSWAVNDIDCWKKFTRCINKIFRLVKFNSKEVFSRFNTILFQVTLKISHVHFKCEKVQLINFITTIKCKGVRNRLNTSHNVSHDARLSLICIGSNDCIFVVLFLYTFMTQNFCEKMTQQYHRTIY